MNRDTDRWVRSGEARSRFRGMIDEVAQDEAHVYLLRYDKPVAVIVPVTWYEAVKTAIEEGGQG